MFEAFTDPSANLAATRFTIWWLFLLMAGFYGAYLYRECRFRVWLGGPFDRALAGWTIEAASLSMHQFYWWAVEYYRVTGKCLSHDPTLYSVEVCRRMMSFQAWAPYVTPFFYVGVIVGAVLILPPIIVSVVGVPMIWARLGTKLCVVVLLSVGLVIVG